AGDSPLFMKRAATLLDADHGVHQLRSDRGPDRLRFPAGADLTRAIRRSVAAVAQLRGQPLDAGLVDEVFGGERQRLPPGFQRLDVTMLGAERDAEIEQLDGALKRVSPRLQGGRAADRVDQVVSRGVPRRRKRL